jgi:hypothetical protein
VILEQPLAHSQDEIVNVLADETIEQVVKKSIPTKSGKSSFSVVITRKKTSDYQPVKELESSVAHALVEKKGLGLGIEVEAPQSTVVYQQTSISHIPMLPEDHTEWPQLGSSQKMDYNSGLPFHHIEELSDRLEEEFNPELRHVGTSPPPEEFLDGIATIAEDDSELFASESRVFDQEMSIEQEPSGTIRDAELSEDFQAPQVGHHPAPPPPQHIYLSGYPFSADPNSSLAPPPDIGHHFLGYAFVPPGYIPVVPMPVPVMMMAQLPGMNGFPFHSGATNGHSEEDEESDNLSSIDLPRFNFEQCSEWLQSRMHFSRVVKRHSSS